MLTDIILILLNIYSFVKAYNDKIFRQLDCREIDLLRSLGVPYSACFFQIMCTQLAETIHFQSRSSLTRLPILHTTS